MTLDRGAAGPATSPWSGVRTIIVPPDIVPVRRTSPLPVRKRTLCRPHAIGQPTERGGAREWFSDHIFADAHQPHIRAACGTSMTVHVSCVMVVLAVLLTRPYEPPLVKVGPPLGMPTMMAMVALPVAPPLPAPAQAVERPAPKPAPTASKLPPPPPPAAAPLPAGITAPAPIEAPSGIDNETGFEGGADGLEGGVTGGVAGGEAGGVGGGLPGGTGSEAAGAPAPLRLGGGIQPPLKIKDVKPKYPQGALSDQTRGSVVIEAVVGVDGKVTDARVIQSVPLLDQSALDAVRQWEFLPSRLNGMPVAVIITVIVQFAIY